MSDTLQACRLTETKERRRAEEAIERERVAANLLNKRTRRVTELEEALAKLEKDLAVKEERWRLADDYRQQAFYERRLGEVESRGDGDAHKNQSFAQTAPQFGASFKPHSAASAAQESLFEEKERKLVERIEQLQEQLTFEQAKVLKLKTWADADHYMGKGDEGWKEIVEEQKVKFSALHEQENKEMADAAYQTIKTLREMLEQKKTQVRSKEDMIDKLRQQMADERERHAEEVSKLTSEQTAAGRDALASLQAYVSRQ